MTFTGVPCFCGGTRPRAETRPPWCSEISRRAIDMGSPDRPNHRAHDRDNGFKHGGKDRITRGVRVLLVVEHDPDASKSHDEIDPPKYDARHESPAPSLSRRNVSAEGCIALMRTCRYGFPRCRSPEVKVVRVRELGKNCDSVYWASELKSSISVEKRRHDPEGGEAIPHALAQGVLANSLTPGGVPRRAQRLRR